MAARRNYRRYRVILQEEDSGYRMDPKKELAGYVKVEVKGGKGVLTAFVQNLKYSKEGKWLYKLFLAGLDYNNPRVIEAGILVIDEKGKGQAVWEFETNNVGGKGCAIDQVDIVGVKVHQRYKSSELVCPLIGFIGQEKGEWKEILIKGRGPKIEEGRKHISDKKEKLVEREEKADKHSTREEEETRETEEESVPVGIEGEDPYKAKEKESDQFPEQQKEEQDTPGEETRGDSIERHEEGVYEDGKQEEATDEEYDIGTSKEGKISGEDGERQHIEEDREKGDREAEQEDSKKETERSPAEERVEKTRKEAEEKQEQQPQHSEKRDHFQVEEYMEHVLKYYCRVQPFEYPIDRCKWWCINSYNYLFGIRYNQDNRVINYIYGIPGPYDPYIEKQMKSCGFLNWRPVKGKGKQQGTWGYWLAFVDAKTGQIVNLEDL